MTANLSVVITGLPKKVTLGQISKFCGKVGVLATHPETGEDLILYNARANKATVTYNFPDGATHAIDLLSNGLFCEGHRVTIERAPREPFDFSQWKGEMRQQRRFHAYLGDHDEVIDNSEQKKLRIMILKNVFEPRELVVDPELYGLIIQDWTRTCEAFGKVTLVKPIEAHPKGVVIVRFDDPKFTALAIGDLDGAQYRERTVAAEPWDGSDLSARESEEIVQHRIRRYERFIDGEDAK